MAGTAASSQTSIIRTADELSAAIGIDPRLRGWTIRSQGPGWIELEVVGLQRGRGPVIVVACWPELWRDRSALGPHLVRARSGTYGLLLVGSDDDFNTAAVEELAADGDVVAMSIPASVARVALALRSRAESVALRMMAASLELELERAHHENDMLISIGRALSQQRDINSLLAIILRRAREVTGADAGSVYIVEGDDEGAPRTLRFTVSQNDSRKIESRGFTMPVSSSSIVGMCVLSSDVINIPDLYALDVPGLGNNPWGFVHHRGFDDKYKYQTRSMLTVPMISARSQVIGVIQLINKRGKGSPQVLELADLEKWVIPFNDVSVAYATSLASQAGIALENAMLYDEVKTLFEGFVRASVTAIESRDPTTSGHSERVAIYTVGLAKAVDRVDSGPFRDVNFGLDELKQVEYAALLHDFGKVGVREHVLIKAKKLYEHQRELILQRFELIRRGFEVEGLKKRVEYLASASREQMAEAMGGSDREMVDRLAEIDEFVTFILQANEPTVLDQGGFERIAVIASKEYLDRGGVARPFLDPEEARALQIIRGSLTDAERDEINSHVVHTYNFLREIPWGKTFRNVPEIAGAHHEKLNGKGYPRRLVGDAIPVPARMMTISDIYDALTAKDRPYKKAIPIEKALSILESEVKQGMLDAELFRVFCEAKVYDVTKAEEAVPRRRAGSLSDTHH